MKRNHRLIYHTHTLCAVKGIDLGRLLNIRSDSGNLIHVSCCHAAVLRAEIIGCFLPVVQETMSVKNCEGHSLRLVHTLAGVHVHAIMGVDEHRNTRRSRTELASVNEVPSESTERNLLEPFAIAYHTHSLATSTNTHLPVPPPTLAPSPSDLHFG